MRITSANEANLLVPLSPVPVAIELELQGIKEMGNSCNYPERMIVSIGSHECFSRTYRQDQASGALGMVGKTTAVRHSTDASPESEPAVNVCDTGRNSGADRDCNMELKVRDMYG